MTAHSGGGHGGQCFASGSALWYTYPDIWAERGGDIVFCIRLNFKNNKVSLKVKVLLKY